MNEQDFANEDWIIEIGDDVIQQKAEHGMAALTPLDRVIYCLWVADYGMRNAGDLETAADLYATFQEDAARLAADLGLSVTHSAFSLATTELKAQYFGLFEAVCAEIRAAKSGSQS